MRRRRRTGVKTTLEDAGGRCSGCGVRPAANVVLVGHGLVHDLRALKFDHLPVIDTACLFAYENLPRSTPRRARPVQAVAGRWRCG